MPALAGPLKQKGPGVYATKARTGARKQGSL